MLVFFCCWLSEFWCCWVNGGFRALCLRHFVDLFYMLFYFLVVLAVFGLCEALAYIRDLV